MVPDEIESERKVGLRLYNFKAAERTIKLDPWHNSDHKISNSNFASSPKLFWFESFSAGICHKQCMLVSELEWWMGGTEALIMRFTGFLCH